MPQDDPLAPKSNPASDDTPPVGTGTRLPEASLTDNSSENLPLAQQPLSDAQTPGTGPSVHTDSPPLPQTAVTPSQAPKKYGGKKVIATIFVVAFLIIGTISTIILVQRNQDIRRKASSGAACSHSADCVLLDNPGNSGNHTAPRTIVYIDITNQTSYRYNPGDTNDGCYDVRIQGHQVTWNRVGSGSSCKDISNIQIWMGTGGNTPTPPTQVTASCGSIKAYDTNWNLLSSSDLTNLKAGDVIRVAVAGTATSGVFDKARFTINGTLQPEVTQKKPSSQEFYDEYTIPAGTLNFTVTAQVHHSSLGWF